MEEFLKTDVYDNVKLSQFAHFIFTGELLSYPYLIYKTLYDADAPRDELKAIAQEQLTERSKEITDIYLKDIKKLFQYHLTNQKYLKLSLENEKQFIDDYHKSQLFNEYDFSDKFDILL